MYSHPDRVVSNEIEQIMNMKHLLTLAGLLAVSGPVLAHGGHAPVPGDSVLHLLAHHWPLLLGLGTGLSALPFMLKRGR